MGRIGTGIAVAVAGLTVALGGCAALVSGAGGTRSAGTLAGAAGTATGPGTAPGPGAGTDPGAPPPAVPAPWEALDARAAATCPGLPWGVLAAIGRVESDSGRSTAPGVAGGANPAGAEGPMQFEPGTFAAYATAGPGGAVPPSPYDPVDAVYSAARLLCAAGGGSPAGLAGAVRAYDHDDSYVDVVLVLASALDEDPGLDATVAAALAFAAARLGTPYVWGGTGAAGFDCSGLVQAAFGSAGVTLPRTARDQFDAGPRLAAGAAVAPGDLVFFGPPAGPVDHVGLYAGSGEMIDAPHAGAAVRVEPAAWDDLVGATRPG